jgi:DNA-binding NtrC family response regulator
VIVMTAFADLASAIAALREGAHDFLTKPFAMADLSAAVDRAAESYRLGEARRHRPATPGDERLAALVGASEAMMALKATIAKVADSEATVLLLGESGTGKELVARALHDTSARRAGPFVPVNCAAIPGTLLEAELFGHEKGAFTGALQRNEGLVRHADHGTIFLDEIADMPPPLQAKMLRVLQDKRVRPVGGTKECLVDVRVISATNRDVGSLLKHRKLREDLYYRLAVIPVTVPRLRERAGDIPILARHFIDRAARRAGTTFDGLGADAIAWLETQPWPGNVRQLENVIERAVALSGGRTIGLDDVAPSLPTSSLDDVTTATTLAELEHRHIREVLTMTNGDKRAAARILGVSLRTVQRKVPPGAASGTLESDGET